MTLRSIITIAGVPALFVCAAASAQLPSTSSLGTPGVPGVSDVLGYTQVGVATGNIPTSPAPAARPASPLKSQVAQAVAPAGVGVAPDRGLVASNGVTVSPPGGKPVALVGERQTGGVLGALGPK